MAAIKNRWTGEVIFESDGALKETVIAAVRAMKSLRGADLRGAVLRGADLSDAVLRDADLSDADLSGAVLRDADLRGADLRDADLSGAVLRDAVLRDADLRGAVLSGADLALIRADITDVLISAPHEIAGLRQALVEGRIDGSVYEGECACLVGTIANVKGCNYLEIPNLHPNSSRPAEIWFLALKPGMTPENSPVAKITLEWIDRVMVTLGQSPQAAEVNA